MRGVMQAIEVPKDVATLAGIADVLVVHAGWNAIGL